MNLTHSTLLGKARQLLARVDGFKNCAPAVLDQMVALGYVQLLASGDYSVRHNDPHRQICLLIEGVMEGSLMHRDGQRHLLGLLLPGDFYALKSHVDGLPEFHDVIARTACSIFCVPKESFRQLRREHVQVIEACELQIVQRARLMQSRMAADGGAPLAVRAAHMLHMFASLYGCATPEGIVLTVRLSQTDMADWLGLSRQRMNFALRQLQDEGLIRIKRSALTILNLPALEIRGSV